MPKLNDAINVTYSDAEFGAAGAVSVGSMGGNISGDFEKLSNIMKTGLSSFNQTTVGRVGADLATKAFPGPTILSTFFKSLVPKAKAAIA